MFQGGVLVKILLSGGGLQICEKPMARGLRRLAVSGGVGGVPAWILLSGGAFKLTKTYEKPVP